MSIAVVAFPPVRLLHRCVINALSLSDLAFFFAQSLPKLKRPFRARLGRFVVSRPLGAGGILMGTLIGDE